MSYIIRKSDGSLLIELQDEFIDENSSSITLIGKNISNYGEYYNENLIRMLENFANSQQPDNALVGQLWYDRAAGLMKVYSDNGNFETLIPPIASPGLPENVVAGQLWIDTTNDQLKFTSNSTSFILAGPIYTRTQGKSGFVVESILDSNSDLKDVTCLYNKGTFIAAISEVGFTVNDSSLATVGQIRDMFPGINLSQSLSGIFLNGSSSRAFLADNVENFTATLSVSNIPPIFLTNYPGGMEITTGTLTVLNDAGLKVGLNENIVLRSQGTLAGNNITSFIIHDIADRPLQIQGKNLSDGYYTALYLDSANKRLGVLTNNPTSTMDVNGDTVVRGNLTVLGTTTYVVTNDLRINDKNIELNYSVGPTTDLTAENGGIILKGSTDHSILWTASYDQSWSFNNNVNLEYTTSSYKIAGVNVLTSSTLGPAITSAPGISSLGVLSYLTVSNVVITTSTISVNGNNLILSPSGSNNIDADNHKIINLSTCTNNLDAANKKYVDDSLYQFSSRFSFTVDETLMINPVNEILSLINLMFPVTNTPPYDPLDIPDGSRARILCSTSSFVTTAISPVSDTRSTVTVDKGGVQNSVSVLQDINFSIPSTNVIVGRTYKVREYVVVSGAWTYVGVVT
jgi:hypothetical protein